MGGIARLGAAWAVPTDATVPLAYLAAGLGGALLGAVFASTTRHLRRSVRRAGRLGARVLREPDDARARGLERLRARARGGHGPGHPPRERGLCDCRVVPAPAPSSRLIHSGREGRAQPLDALQQPRLRRLPVRHLRGVLGTAPPIVPASALPDGRELPFLLRRHLRAREGAGGPARAARVDDPVRRDHLRRQLARLLRRPQARAAPRARAARKALLLVSIVYYLGVLSVFKYFNFAVDSFATVMSWAGVHVSPTHLRLVLPFGISFFTFETMSYTIDVYRREIPPADRYLDYLLFVCFFPHLVAGPIVRPKSMLPQLARRAGRDRRDEGRGPLPDRDGPLQEDRHRRHARHQPGQPRVRQPRALLVARGAGRGLRVRDQDLRGLLRLHATSRSAAPSCSATSCRRTSTRPTYRGASRSSGTAGTSRCRRGCATTSTSRSAATAARRGRPTAT